MPPMTSGRVSTSTSLLPLRSCGCECEPLAAEVGLLQLVPLDHRAHRAVENEEALGEQCVESFRRASFRRLPLVPAAISTVNGSPVRRAPTRTIVLVNPASCNRPASARLAEAEPAIAELRLHPGFFVLTQIQHKQPAAGPQNARGFGERALRMLGVMKRLRQERDVDRRVLDRQPLEIAALPGDVRELAALRPAPGRASSTSFDRSTAITRRAQRAASSVR